MIRTSARPRLFCAITKIHFGFCLLRKSIGSLLVVVLCASLVVPQKPLPSPGIPPVVQQVLAAQGHSPGQTVPPPHPPNGLPAALLPNIHMARSLELQIGQSLDGLGVHPKYGMREIGMACDAGCAGDEPSGGGGSDPDFSTAR